MDIFFRAPEPLASSGEHGSRLRDAILSSTNLVPMTLKAVELLFLAVSITAPPPTMMIVSHSNFICFPPNRAIHHDVLLS